MRIEFETDTITQQELLALAALIDVLSDGDERPKVVHRPKFVYVGNDGGSAGSGGNGGSAGGGEFHAIQEHVVTRAAPPPPSEQLMEQAVTARHDPNILDSEGIPWDARIHASTRNTNKDGTWKKLRGVDEVTYGKIHAELVEQYAGKGTGTTANDGAPLAGVSAPPPPAPSPEPNAPLAPPPPPAAEPAPTVSAAADAGNAARFADFPAFVQAVNLIRPNGIPYAELNTFAATVGVPGGFKDMKDHAHLWETFYAIAGGQ